MRAIWRKLIRPRVKDWPENVVPINSFEVCAFPWGAAVRHLRGKRGKWQRVFLNDGQEIDVSNMDVIIDEYGITFILPEEEEGEL